jgi:hypothetical protein
MWGLHPRGTGDWSLLPTFSLAAQILRFMPKDVKKKGSGKSSLEAQ